MKPALDHKFIPGPMENRGTLVCNVTSKGAIEVDITHYDYCPFCAEELPDE